MSSSTSDATSQSPPITIRHMQFSEVHGLRENLVQIGMQQDLRQDMSRISVQIDIVGENVCVKLHLFNASSHHIHAPGKSVVVCTPTRPSSRKVGRMRKSYV